MTLRRLSKNLLERPSRHSLSLLRSGLMNRTERQSGRDLDLEFGQMLAVRTKAAELVARLTARQSQILNLVADGQPTKIIAADLGISERTVEKHRATISQRTGCKSLAAVIHTAVCARCSLNKADQDDQGGAAVGARLTLMPDDAYASQKLAADLKARPVLPLGNGTAHSGALANVNPSRNSCADGDWAMRDEDAMRVSMNESQHRVSNMVAVIQSICRQTMRQSATKEEFETKFSGRLTAFCSSFTLLISNHWQNAEIYDLLRTQLKQFGSAHEPQISLYGPAVQLTPSAARNIGMAVHELATNALKYGALSVPEGRVAITWRHHVHPNAECFELSWMERDSPAVGVPDRKGFGRQLVERLIPMALNGTSTYVSAPTGVCWTLTVPLADAIITNRAIHNISNGAETRQRGIGISRS
jgi:two-component sensor histidine kinase